MSKLLKKWNRLAFSNGTRLMNEARNPGTLEDKYIYNKELSGDDFSRRLEAEVRGFQSGWTGSGWICGYDGGITIEPIEGSWERDIVDVYISVDGDSFYCYLINNRSPFIIATSEEDLISQLNSFASSVPFKTEDDAHAYTSQQGLKRPY